MRLSILTLGFSAVLAAAPVLAAEPHEIKCPDNKPCKVVVLTEQEVQILTGPNGILDTASKARNLDLGQFVVYFQNKLANAPSGEVTPAPSPSPAPTGTPAAKDKSK